MKKQPYSKHRPEAGQQQRSKKAVQKQQTREILKRLLSPKKILANEATATPINKADPTVEHSAEPLDTQSMENTETGKEEAVITPEIPEAKQQRSSEPAKDSNINLVDSGFFEPVIQRDYAETPQSHIVEPKPVEPAPEPEKPKILFAPKLTLKTDETYKKVMGDGAYTDVSLSSEPEQPAIPPADQIPGMQFQEAVTQFDLSDNADSMGRQLGQEAGNTTSEWAFGMLENFYPEVVAFFTKIPTDWIEKAKLPNALEAEMLQKILAANTRNKNKVKISDFHKKNILPPLKRILEKKGWENVMPDELLLCIGLVVLAADSFFKIGEIKKENRVLEKQIKQKVQEYIDVRTEERKEIDTLKGQLGEMSAFMAQFKAMQQQAQPAAA